MSLITEETVRVIAETIDFPLPDDVAVALAPDVEFRLREIAQEAAKFMRHAKRTKMTTADVNNALRLRNVESLYGFSDGAPAKFVPVGGSDLFYVEDKEVDLQEIVSAPLPKLPVDVSFTTHWLSIDGVQPHVPQNPPPEELVESGKAAEASKARGTAAALAKQSGGAADGEGEKKVKPLVKLVLSKELLLYFDKVTAAIKGRADDYRDAVCDSVAEDPGITRLVPYLCQFVQDEVVRNLRDVHMLTNLMMLASALLRNEHLHVEPYLHQLMPAILTCVVGKRLCAQPEDDHWSLRDLAASLLRVVCEKFGDAYRNLQPRITRTLLYAFMDPLKPYTTHYGALRALSGLGAHVVETLVLPNLATYTRELTKALEGPQVRAREEATRVRSVLLGAVGVFLRANKHVFAHLHAAQSGAAGEGEGGGVDSAVAALEAKASPAFAQHYALFSELFGEEIVPFFATGGDDANKMVL